MDVPRIFC